MKYFHDRYWKRKKSPTDDYADKVNLIKSLVPKEKKLEVLDFGCGKGDITKAIFSANPSLQITGVDVSSVAVATARKTSPGKFYTIKEGKKLPFKSSCFDFIVALDVFQCIYDTEFAFKELFRVLKPKGRSLITVQYFGMLKNVVISLFAFDKVFNPRSTVIRFYTKKDLINEITACGLKLVTFGYFGRFYPFSRGIYCISRK